MAPPKSSVLVTLSCLLALAPTAFAQTFTYCNPMNRTDCPTDTALGTNMTWNLSQGKVTDDHVWNATGADLIDWGQQGAAFQIKGSGDSPTLQSKFYIFWGTVSVIMKASAGTGIVSSMVMESDDLDEIDWEFIGGNNTHVQTNYFGKGNTTSYDRAIWYPVDNPQQNSHNYTVTWNQNQIQWWIDNNMIRTLNYADANGGYNFPQTPMNLRIGIWAGGDAAHNKPGVVEWAGGKTDFHQGPFTMFVESVYAKDGSNGAEYKYSDKSGSWQSITVTPGESSIVKYELEPHGVAAHWKALPHVARIAIVASALGVAGLSLVALVIFCIKQRRAGRREHHRFMEIERREAEELAEYKRQHAEEIYGHNNRRF